MWLSTDSACSWLNIFKGATVLRNVMSVMICNMYGSEDIPC